MNQDSLSRRRFLINSVLTTGGLLLAPNFISCSDDDTVYAIPRDYTSDKFPHGVASFDPTHDQVIIWTRYNTTESSVSIIWQVAYDPDFETVFRSGEVTTDASRDYTVAIELQNLEPNKKLYYRFFNMTERNASVVGETITLPLDVNEIKLAVCSCSNYPAGLFNVYNAMANSDADIIVHLGDYIYEYGQDQYGTNDYTNTLGRSHHPANEIITLNDYRTRYKQYRSDKNLQLAHQKKPFICVWDDHEIANDTYKDGAENHQASEGSFEARKEAAIKAYSEFLPMKTNDINLIYRSFKIGNLVNLIMLDTRIIGRDQQLDYANYYDTSGNFDVVSFQTDWLNPNRSILGSTQRNWLISEVTGSPAHWQVLGQQVLMGKMMIPTELLGTLAAIQSEGSASPATLQYFQQQITELVTIKLRFANGDPTLTPAELARINTVLPYNLDAWDGYPMEREMLYAGFAGKKVISLAGDTHNAWYNKLTDNSNNEKGKEFATSSVSSPGLEVYLGIDPSGISGFEDALQLLIDDMDYLNASDRGYVTVKFTPSTVDAEWNFVSSVFTENYTETTERTESYSL
ncbi:alkaline phosphatase D family protein [Flavobacterium sp. NRK F10]|uniref:alkaline phosphatase D family protein n=1 Tax=Flavobacterium sp. NRK F10 TaxID=2954931 RepID=UPI002090D4A2|nr:alkaline phosphatase D family protein [Flavobacterium sp. NRK F10]MCO6174869.1 alkaline phosphatase D family protein [Flavobacterium sp. NRK F10]